MLRSQVFLTESSEERKTLEKQGNKHIFFYNKVKIFKKLILEVHNTQVNPKVNKIRSFIGLHKLKKIVLKGETNKIKINNQKCLLICKGKF